MDSLLLSQLRPTSCPPSVHPPSVLFRSCSVATTDLLSSTNRSGNASGSAATADEEDDSALLPVSDPSTSAQTNRNRISLAKSILSEACTTRLARANCAGGMLASAAVTAGPLGSLLLLLSTASSAEKACACLTTLSFLLLDRANRKVVADLDGVATMLQAMQAYPEPQVQLAALEAIVAMVKHDAAEKARLWQRDAEGTLVGLIDPQCPAPHLQRLLRLLNKAAFCVEGCTPVRLLEPRLMAALASLLHPAADAGVMHFTLKMLQSAAQCSDASDLPSWLPAIFQLAPLLHERPAAASAAACADSGQAMQAAAGTIGGRSILDGVLNPLLTLSDHEAFRNALLAAGCLPPLLPLLSHNADAIKVAATCILANLVESPMCREQMCTESAVHALLDALHVASCTEATVGLLYVLGRLATSRPHVVSVLRQYGTAPLTVMMQCNPGDKDVLLGLQQLLELMQVSGGHETGSSGSGSGSGSGTGSGVSLGTGSGSGASLLGTANDSSATRGPGVADTEVHILSVAGERAKSYVPRSMTQVSSASSIVNLCALSWL